MVFGNLAIKNLLNTLRDHYPSPAVQIELFLWVIVTLEWD